MSLYFDSFKGLVSKKFYNLSVKTFPDGTKQYRFYERPLEMDSGPPSMVPSDLERPDKDIEHVVRARSNLYDIARSNHWDWFITITMDPQVVDRSDYVACQQVLNQYCRWLTKHGILYLIVPEFHEDDECYHFHGLLQGTPPMHRGINQGHNKYYGLPMVDQKGRPVYNLDYHDLGWTTATAVTDSSRCASYLCKYFSKELLRVVPKGKRRYLASNKLLKPTIEKLEVSGEDFEFIKKNMRFTKQYCDLLGNRIILCEE